jgi:DNA-binding MarR family transcriptional regulator
MYHTLMGTTPDEAAAAVLETIPPAMRAIKERMRSARAANLSVSQFRMLLFVRRHPGTDLSAVADHMGTTLPSASQLMSRLVAAGMLARTVHPTERRHLQLTVTDSGAAALGECDLRTRQWLRDRLAGATPEQLERLTSALTDLLVLIEGAPGAPGGRPPEPRRNPVGSGTT